MYYVLEFYSTVSKEWLFEGRYKVINGMVSHYLIESIVSCQVGRLKFRITLQYEDDVKKEKGLGE
jgi:hypothetical protein